MKRIFLNLFAVATLGLAMTACNNDEANKKAAEADDAAVQTLVDEKAKAIDAEVAAACEERINAAATAAMDSIAKANPKQAAVIKKVAAAVKPKAKPAATTTPKTQPTAVVPGNQGRKEDASSANTNVVNSGRKEDASNANTNVVNTGRRKQ